MQFWDLFSKDHKPLTKFTLFGQLIPELRCHIWRLAFVEYLQNANPLADNTEGGAVIQLSTVPGPNPNRTHLQFNACKEAREEMVRMMASHPGIGTRFNNPSTGFNAWTRRSYTTKFYTLFKHPERALRVSSFGFHNPNPFGCTNIQNIRLIGVAFLVKPPYPDFDLTSSIMWYLSHLNEFSALKTIVVSHISWVSDPDGVNESVDSGRLAPEIFRVNIQVIVEKIREELKSTHKRCPNRKMPLIIITDYSVEPINQPEPREGRFTQLMGKKDELMKWLWKK